MPFFSIIIPTFNSASKIAGCLESIFSQNFSSYEVCIVDGASTDETIRIIKGMQVKYPQVNLVSEKDRGIYDAMNKGIKIAKGEWLYFLGSDDKLNNRDVFQQVYSFDKQNHNVIYGNAKIIGNTPWAKDGDIYDGKFDLQKLLKKNLCQQAIFYNKKCFTGTINFNRVYKICADWDFNFRCWATHPFLFIDLIIVDFYGGGESTNNNNDELFFKDFSNNLIKYFGPGIMNNFRNIPTDQNVKSQHSNVKQGIRNRLKRLFHN
jgi:glycosyltransferase involved in cell wall biosynthesis